ncbi:RelA/SpoT domain-containing protein [Bifidobacterium animalis]|uniref:RelA/SpoT domain-containing protein n=1 Tax=Bifidobacterium animalis TaxID=28025 RepID=UPI0003FE2F0F|nr:RelA/SpoT domain-containing protein [Bifidobacterium animalis]KOA44123.1 hypothetical protein BAAA27673_08180 [Bifidobacterium animalis subsp. lactis ATCC 27673]UBZ01291.1 RelA/SpoT domain-containing protein [Bifidobacterium animalis subsp. lactis]
MAEARAKRLISRSAANKAGEQIRKSSPQFADDTYHDAVVQAMQWRNQHFAPTQQCFRQILDAIDDIDGAVATFRLKRLISIENKLRRANSDFKLGALDDIGGCRVILDSIDQVEQVKNALTKRFSLKNGNKIKDYIQQPQTSGYRSCHLFAKMDATDGLDCSYRVEIQIRTCIEHAWATAVEGIGELYNGDYKSPEKETITGEADLERRQFLKIISSLFALEEGTPQVPGLGLSRPELIRKLRSLPAVNSLLYGLEQSANDVKISEPLPDTLATGNDLFLLKFNTSEQLTDIEAFSLGHIDDALDRYNYYEKLIDNTQQTLGGTPFDNVVLTYARNPDQLKLAYPNYSANLSMFLEKVTNYFDEDISIL